jgi:outer membrane protein assembly factor BamA
MKHTKILAAITFILFVFMFPVCGFGATETTESDKAPAKFFPFPIISYSPETGLALGGMCYYYPNMEASGSEQKPDTLSALLFATQKGQYVGNLNVSKYYFEGKQWLLIKTTVANYPSYFYGIGSGATSAEKENYTIEEWALDASYLWEIKEHLYLGPSLLYANASISDKTMGGLLEEGDIIGSNGTIATGVGLNLVWDETKDFGRQGFIISLQANDFSKDWGSSEDFTRVNLDCRKYIPISQDQVIAIQGVLTSTSGSVPFEFLPSIGGTIRGIEGGRFCDKNCLAFQGEYRFPVRGIFSMAVFGGFAEVAPSLGEFNFSDFKAMGGFGFRFALDKEHNVKLRLDVSGTLDNPLVYFNFGEAF